MKTYIITERKIKTLKSEIDNLKTPLLKKLWAKIKNLNINLDKSNNKISKF